MLIYLRNLSLIKVLFCFVFILVKMVFSWSWLLLVKKRIIGPYIGSIRYTNRGNVIYKICRENVKCQLPRIVIKHICSNAQLLDSGLSVLLLNTSVFRFFFLGSTCLEVKHFVLWYGHFDIAGPCRQLLEYLVVRATKIGWMCCH